MDVGIASNVVTGSSAAEVADKVRRLGFTTVQYVPDEVVIGFGYDTEVPGTPEEAAEAFAAVEIDVGIVGGYVNILHPDPGERNARLDLLKGYIRGAAAFGCRLVSTETGTYGGHDYEMDERNRVPAALDDLRRVTEELLEVARAEDVVLLYEPYIVNVCHSPRVAAQLIREFASPHLGLLMDPCNWFDAESARPERVVPILEQGFAAEWGLFRAAHAKDVAAAPGPEALPALPPAGRGILDYHRYVELLLESGYDGPLILEHLHEHEVPAVRDFVQAVIDDCGGSAGAAA